jgi:uncharacterized membrane protein YeaQ/YmgE (transglycosylase-associated protein family)
VPTLPDPRWWFAEGCLSGILCGIAGAVLGGWWGYRLDTQEAGKWYSLRFGDFVPQRTIFWLFVGGLFGWALGWLLTAILPRKRRRTLIDYVLIVLCGPLPFYALNASNRLAREELEWMLTQHGVLTAASLGGIAAFLIARLLIRRYRPGDSWQ